MVVIHKEDILTHPPHDPQLWLETGVIDELDRNRVYDISMTTTQDMRMCYSVLTVHALQFSPSQPSLTI
jgi:hypothetical protein